MKKRQNKKIDICEEALLKRITRRFIAQGLTAVIARRRSRRGQPRTRKGSEAQGLKKHYILCFVSFSGLPRSLRSLAMTAGTPCAIRPTIHLSNAFSQITGGNC